MHDPQYLDRLLAEVRSDGWRIRGDDDVHVAAVAAGRKPCAIIHVGKLGDSGWFDDEPYTLEMMTSFLESHGCKSARYCDVNLSRQGEQSWAYVGDYLFICRDEGVRKEYEALISEYYERRIDRYEYHQQLGRILGYEAHPEAFRTFLTENEQDRGTYSTDQLATIVLQRDNPQEYEYLMEHNPMLREAIGRKGRDGRAR